MSNDEGRARFAAAVAEMAPLLAALQQAPRFARSSHPTIPRTAGIYLFSVEETPIYVGQTRNLRERLRQHTIKSSNHDSASFAFNLAKAEACARGIELGKRRRAELSADSEFAAIFAAARVQVSEMNVQFIEVADPIVRTMFEMYVALVLGTTEYNSFETH